MKLTRGFSLLEVVIAVLLLAGVLFSLGVLIPQSLAYTHNTGYESMGCQMAEKLLSEIHAMPISSVPTSQTFDGRPQSLGGPTTATAPTTSGFPPAPYPSQSVNLTSSGSAASMTYYFVVSTATPTNTITHTYPSGVIQVQVQVYWSEGRGGSTWNRSWAITSYVGV